MRYLEECASGVDLVVAHMTRGMVLANCLYERSGIPFVCVIHGSDVATCKKLKNVFANARAVYTRSESLQKRVEKCGFKVDGVVFSGIEANLIGMRKAVDFRPGGKLRLITVSNLQRLKNIDVVLEALASLPSRYDWEYKIIGDGEQFHDLRLQIGSLGITKKVTMLGHQKRDYCLDAMRRSDVFVMPSAPETLGLAYLEAMASGCIVIGTKGWGIDGIVEDGVNGYLVEARSVSDLTRTLKLLLDTDQQTIFEHSLNTIRRYTFENAVQNYADCLAKALENRSATE